MSDKKITYKEVKSRQKQDLKSGTSKYYIYRHLSTPFTWAFVNLGVSANAVTISSFFLCLVGFYILSQGTYGYLILGLFLFIIIKIIDMSDGEVARIQNAGSTEGVFFDRVSHYINSTCLGVGLGFGLYRIYLNDIYIYIGFLFALAFTLEYAVAHSFKGIILEKTASNEGKRKIYSIDKVRKLNDDVQKKVIKDINGKISWDKANIFSKLLRIFPFQGIIYSDTFSLLILLILSVIEYFLSSNMIFPITYGIAIGIIPIYLLIVSISKIIWFIYFILKMEKNRYLTERTDKL